MLIDDERLNFVRLGTAGRQFQPGTFRMGDEDRFGCGFFEYNFRRRQITFFAECSGSVTFDQAGGNPRAPVSGSLDLQIWARGG